MRFRVTPTRDASDGPVIVSDQATLQSDTVPVADPNVYRTDDPAGEEDVTVVVVTGLGLVHHRTMVLSPGTDFVPFFEFTTP